MASFQAKIGWKRWRKGENTNCLSVPFVLDGKYKIPLQLHFKPKYVEKGREIEKIKNVVPFRSHQRVIENSKKIEKNLRKLKKYHYGVISSQNWLEKTRREKIKIIVSFRSALTLQIKFKKNSKKIQ